MPKLPRITPKKLLSVLSHQGFYIKRQRGSHCILENANGRYTVVPLHTKDIPPGTLRGILRDIDISLEKFIHLL